MWKALINWINSKSQKCEHSWEQLAITHTYGDDLHLPEKINYTYRCTKCCDSKTIST